jgi:hypothetical protein
LSRPKPTGVVVPTEIIIIIIWIYVPYCIYWTSLHSSVMKSVLWCKLREKKLFLLVVKAYNGVEVELHPFLTTSLDGCEWYICQLKEFNFILLHFRMRWSSWLRHCAKSRKVAGSIPDGVTGIFHWHNPSCRSMTLESIQPLSEMSTRNISWSKGGRCVWMTTLPLSCADCLEIWEPEPPRSLKACPGL